MVNVKRTREGGIELRPSSCALVGRRRGTPRSAKLTLEGFKVNVAGRVGEAALTHHVQVASLEASEITTANGLKGAIAAKLGLDKGGSIDLTAPSHAEPLVLNAKVDVRRIDPSAAAVPRAVPECRAEERQRVGERQRVPAWQGRGAPVSYNGGAEIANP